MVVGRAPKSLFGCANATGFNGVPSSGQFEGEVVGIAGLVGVVSTVTIRPPGLKVNVQ